MTEPTTQHAWFSPTLALRHGWAVWVNAAGVEVKCSAVAPDNPFPPEVTDARYAGEVSEFRRERYGMLPPLESVNPLKAYDSFPAGHRTSGRPRADDKKRETVFQECGATVHKLCSALSRKEAGQIDFECAAEVFSQYNIHLSLVEQACVAYDCFPLEFRHTFAALETRIEEMKLAATQAVNDKHSNK